MKKLGQGLVPLGRIEKGTNFYPSIQQINSLRDFKVTPGCFIKWLQVGIAL
jgi:hypothetical protein